MALTGKEFKKQADAPDITAQGQTCFYCGKPTYDPGIMWSGETGEVYLHISCAVNLIPRLERDVLEYQKGTGKRAITT